MRFSGRSRAALGRCLAVLLLFAFVFTVVAAPVWAAAGRRNLIGDEPADQNNLTGDVVAERQMEEFLLPMGAGSSATLAGLATGAGVFIPMAGALVAASSVIASYKDLPWKNWPMGRYLFWHYPPDKFLGIFPRMASISAWLLDTAANSIFSATKFLVSFGINVMYLAFETEWVAAMADWVGAAARDIFSFTGDSFADVALKISLILLSVMAMQKLLSGHLAGTVQSLIVAVLAFTAVLLYATEAPRIVRGAANITDGVAGAALSASAHFFWQGQNTGQFQSDLDLGLANTGQAVWYACVAAPWAASQFGTTDPNNLVITDEEWSIFDRSAIPEKKYNELSKKVPDGTVYADTLFLGCGDDKCRDAVAEMLGQAEKGGNPLNHGRHPGSVVGFSPSFSIGLHHIGTALMTLLPAAAFVLLILMVGGLLILSQLVVVILLIFAPAVLFAAMVPDAGWAVAARYFKTMLAFLANKVIFGLYLGALLALGTGVVRGILT